MREDIKAYIDGELSTARMEEVRRAIESDPELREEYEAMRRMTQMVRTLARQPQVKGVEQTMRAVAPRRRFRLIEGFVVAGVLVIIAAMVFPVFSQAKMSSKTAQRLSDQKQRELAEMMANEPATKTKDFREWTGEEPEDVLGYPDQNGGGSATKGVPEVSMGSVAKEEDKSRSRAERYGAPDATNLLEASPTAFADRIVIKDASLQVKVPNVQEAMDKATQLAIQMGGYIESSTVADPGENKKSHRGYVSIRLPQSSFEKALEQVRGYGDVRGETTSGDDVTGQVTDIEARIKTLTAEEDSLRTILRSASKIGDVLDIKDRISQVRQQIESYESQRRTLSRLAALSTISVTFTTDVKDEPVPRSTHDNDSAWFQDTKDAALGILKGVGKFVAQVATFAFILIPVWLPALLFLLWFRRRGLAPAQ